MNIKLARFSAVLAAAMLLSFQTVSFADNTAPTPGSGVPATPGTPAATDSKNQENNPAGPDAQTTAHPKEGTKKHKHKTHAPETKGDASGDKATKTPQKDMPPSTTNP